MIEQQTPTELSSSLSEENRTAQSKKARTFLLRFAFQFSVSISVISFSTLLFRSDLDEERGCMH